MASLPDPPNQLVCKLCGHSSPNAHARRQHAYQAHTIASAVNGGRMSAQDANPPLEYCQVCNLHVERSHQVSHMTGMWHAYRAAQQPHQAQAHPAQPPTASPPAPNPGPPDSNHPPAAPGAVGAAGLADASPPAPTPPASPAQSAAGAAGPLSPLASDADPNTHEDVPSDGGWPSDREDSDAGTDSDANEGRAVYGDDRYRPAREREWMNDRDDAPYFNSDDRCGTVFNAPFPLQAGERPRDLAKRARNYRNFHRFRVVKSDDETGDLIIYPIDW